jgi:hypothetical protein
VQVHYGEGVANHADPESCAAYREVCGEALTGERAGQPLSHEIFLIQDADVVTYTEGKMTGATTRVPERSCVVGDPGMYGRSLLGNREISSLAIRSQGVVRVGKARSRSR